MGESFRWGVLIVNLGTPDDTEVASVRRYLRQFLSDPRVIDIPGPLRWGLVNLIIAPTRGPKSAAAYRTIWTERGSPLKYHGEDLTAGVRERLGDRVVGVELAMRYQNPSVRESLGRLCGSGIDGLCVLPLFPQYSMAAWESAVVEVFDRLADLKAMPAVHVVPPFYDDPRFLDACAAVARPVLEELEPDRTLLSFHGVPERHVQRSDPSGAHCLTTADCCERIADANRYCYRAQCYVTARGIAERLDLAPDRWEVAFQSRLGRTPWIRPFTDERIPALPGEGVRRLAVLCPSFVADCLETVEEIGVRARDDFVRAGGERLALAPCVNAEPVWIDAATAILSERLAPNAHETRCDGIAI